MFCSGAVHQNIAGVAVMAGSKYKRNSRDWYLCHVIWDISHGGRGLPDDVRCHGIRDYLIGAYSIYDKRLPLRCGAAHISELHNVMVTACHEPVVGIGVYEVIGIARSYWPCPPARLYVWHRHLCSFSPARCRLQPVRQTPPRGESDFYWQPAGWWRGNVPRCTVQGGDGHISVLSGALRNVWRMHCGVCKIGLLLLLFDRSVQIVLQYSQYWYFYDDMTLVTVFCPGKVKMMYQQHDVLKETVKMRCQKMYMM